MVRGSIAHDKKNIKNIAKQPHLARVGLIGLGGGVGLHTCGPLSNQAHWLKQPTPHTLRTEP